MDTRRLDYSSYESELGLEFRGLRQLEFSV